MIPNRLSHLASRSKSKMPVLVATRLPLSLGHRMSAHLGAMSMSGLTTATASSNWNSTLQQPAVPTVFKKQRAGSVQIDIAALPKAVLSTTAKQQAKGRQSTSAVPPAPDTTIAAENAVSNKAVTTAGNDAAWGVFQSRETFQEMHIC